LGGPTDSEIEKLYREGLPVELVYPGNVLLEWQNIESEIYKACIKASNNIPRLSNYWAICLYIFDDIFEFDINNGPFIIVGLEEGDCIPLYGKPKSSENILYESTGSNFWSSFIDKIKNVQIKDNWVEAPSHLNQRYHDDERYWSDTLEMVFKACCLSALKRARNEGAFSSLGWVLNKKNMPLDTFKPPYPDLRFYVGEDGETAEEWVNRSCDYSRLSMSIDDSRLIL